MGCRDTIVLGAEDTAGNRRNTEDLEIVPGYKLTQGRFANALNAHIHPNPLAICRQFLEERLCGAKPLVGFVVEIRAGTDACLFGEKEQRLGVLHWKRFE